jgi:hypothetical protein
MILAVRLRQSG